jgi:hydroxymethylpyrimidine pyrophosphatase-like HAD family hydrolase
MIQLVIADIEGVLTPSAGSQVAWNLEGLTKVRNLIRTERERLVCILCTGRQAPYAEALIQALGLHFPLHADLSRRIAERWKVDLLSWPSVTENGTSFYDPLAKKVIPNPEMIKEQVENITRLRREVIPLLVRETKCQVEGGKDFSISLNPPLLDAAGTARLAIDDFFLIVKEGLKEFESLLEIKHSASAVDIMPMGISKASAVRLLLESTGIDPSEVLGVGDTMADEEWLRLAGWSATPANGAEVLKHVHYTSPYETEMGFLDILENLKAHGYDSVGP